MSFKKCIHRVTNSFTETTEHFCHPRKVSTAFYHSRSLDSHSFSFFPHRSILPELKILIKNNKICIFCVSCLAQHNNFKIHLCYCVLCYCWVIFHCIVYHHLFTCFPGDEHLDYFLYFILFYAITNKIDMNLLVKVLWWTKFSFPSAKYLGIMLYKRRYTNARQTPVKTFNTINHVRDVNLNHYEIPLHPTSMAKAYKYSL